jgi:hypothetical protein
MISASICSLFSLIADDLRSHHDHNPNGRKSIFYEGWDQLYLKGPEGKTESPVINLSSHGFVSILADPPDVMTITLNKDPQV